MVEILQGVGVGGDLQQVEIVDGAGEAELL
jgi:hypothetical protein